MSLLWRSRAIARGLLASGLFAFALLVARSGSGAEPPPKTRTSTRSAGTTTLTGAVADGLSAEDRELASYIDVLEDLDLLESFEMIRLMPALEDPDDD